ncbi:BamA/TamA family outer membrane protein [Paraflavisolibacter sp. H34]|uniref:BamA/TamA family outer membrane protein n=1 Tax=Huijunlia imazamoxiresistens TaxID=3127457 RepID=UPI003015E938
MNNNLKHLSFLKILSRPGKSLVLLLALLGYPYSHQLAAQPTQLVKKYVAKLVRDTTDIREPQFIVYPTLAYAPETRWEFGLSSLFVYYAKKDTTNRLSEVNGFTFYTLENQYGFWFDHALYSHQNRWSFIGRLRYQNFPLLYFGTGPNTPAQYQARVDARQLNIKERALKKIGDNLFTGVEADLQRISSVNFVAHEPTFTEKPLGHEGSLNLGFGTGIVYDKRHNVMNVREGSFAELALLHYDKRWGSDYSFTSIISDNRFYKSINERDVLAAQVFGQFSVGAPPFNQLSLMGGESLMRGYYLGRYRDRNQISAQVEYRLLPLPFSFTKRWGAAVFGGTGSVFNRFHEFSTRDFVFAGGAGLRFLLFPKKDIFTRLDVAFTKEGRGFYIFIGEAF